jgi:hypothetical protein
LAPISKLRTAFAGGVPDLFMETALARPVCGARLGIQTRPQPPLGCGVAVFVARSESCLDRRDVEAAEIDRLWRRQHLSVLECCPKLYHDIRTAIEEGRGVVTILNLIDAALDRTPTTATIVSAATTAFDQIRKLVTPEERQEFLNLVGSVNRAAAPAVDVKRKVFELAVRHHAGSLLEGAYFDDVRHQVERGA